MEVQKLLNRKKKAVTEKNKDALASTSINLGEYYMRTNEYEEAIKQYKTVALVYKQTNKPMEYGTANRMIGEAYTHLQEYKMALSYQEIYLGVAKQEHNKLEQQRAYATIGHTYLTSYLDSVENEPKKDCLHLASKYFTKSLEISESLTDISKREHMDITARLFSNLGVVQECLGNFDKGIELIKKSINICKSQDIYEQLERGYTSLATLYSKKESYREAIQNINLALEVASRLDDKVCLMCGSYIAKSEILVMLDDLQGAKSTLLKAHKLKSTNRFEREQIENNLKVVAAICYTQDTLLTTSDTDYIKIKGLYERLGDGYCVLKNFKKALEYYEKMLGAALKYSSSKKDLSPCYVSLAQTYLDCKDFNNAITYFEKDYEISKDNPKDGVGSLLSLANALEQGSRSFDEIDTVYKQAESDSGNNMNLLAKVFNNYLPFLKKANKIFEASSVEAKLASLDLNSSDSDSEDDDDSNTPNIGSDICIDEITDDSANSDIETDLNKPRVARKRSRGFVVKRNNKGETQLHSACISGNLTLVQRLLIQNHPVNIRDHCGWLPIHEACICGHIEIVQLLLDKGAHINDRGGTHCNGTTPLHDACSNGHLEVIQLLLDRNASAVAKTDDGDTPLSTLKTWRKNTKLDALESSLYDNIIERMTYALEKSGNKVDNTVNKENVALFTEKPQTSSRRMQASHRPKQSPLKAKPSNKDLRRTAELSDSDSDNNLDISRGRKRNEISSGSSSNEEPINKTGLEYQKVIASFRNRTVESVRKKQKKNSPKKLPALVRADEFVDDDWLEDDISLNKQSRKPRTNSIENLMTASINNIPGKTSSIDIEEVNLSDDDFQITGSFSKGGRKKQMSLIKAGFTRRKSSPSPTNFLPKSSPQMRSQRKQQTKLTDFSHVRNIVEADSTSSLSSTQKNFARKPSNSNTANFTKVMPETMLSVDVRIDGKLYRVPVSLSDANTRTIQWLADEAAKRYCRKECIKPTLELESQNGAVLAEDDLIIILFPMGTLQAEEVHAKVVKWNVPLLFDRYKEYCSIMGIVAMDAISKILQESTTVVNLSNLFSRDKIAPLCKAINRQNNLQHLDISGNYMGDESLQLLAQSLATLDNLSHLNLSNNNLGVNGIKHLADALDSTPNIVPNLTTLILSHNPLGNMSLKELVRVTEHTKLTRLDLVDIRISANLYNYYKPPPLKLDHVEHFNISYNFLDTPQLVKIISSLNMKIVTYLNVGSNAIKEEGFVSELVTKMSDVDQNLPIKHLNLCRVNITDAEVYELIRCLIKTDFMDTLDLSYNENLTAISLRRLLQHSSLYRSLNLIGCVKILEYFEDCTDSLWNILEDTGKKLENLKLSVDYLDNVKTCDVLIEMWKNMHPESYRVFTEMENYVELSKGDSSSM